MTNYLLINNESPSFIEGLLTFVNKCVQKKYVCFYYKSYKIKSRLNYENSSENSNKAGRNRRI